MTDIDPLTDFRADMPAPTAAYLSRTRDSLFSDVPGHGRVRVRSRARTRIAIAGSAAASATAGLVALTFVGAGPASAASVLDQAAKAAAGQPGAAVRAGQYTFAESTTHANGRTTVSQQWLPVDGKGEGLIRDTAGYEIHLRDGAMVSKNPYPLPAGTPLIPIKGGAPLAPLDFPGYDYLLTLPTDPHALLGIIGAQARNLGARTDQARDQEEFFIIAEATSQSFLPPTVRATFYQAAALIPGVTVIKDAKTADGRPGIAVARTDGTQRLELVFDKKTFALLGDQSQNTADGSVIQASVMTGSGIVDKIGQRP
ncbi:MAG: CU044_5270 family protein [Catenulispora sp.]|nr:CU044_5270 family protein [Catenulispora sp.]